MEINKMKKTLIATLLILTNFSYSNDYFSVIGTDAFKYSDTKEIVYTEWENNGVSYNCNTWLPDANEIKIGKSFDQERECSQDQSREKETYFVDSNGDKVLNKTEVENQTIVLLEEQLSIGTLDINGFIYLQHSTNSEDQRNAHDVTKTGNAHWEGNFGQTYDIVINGVSAVNQNLTNTGIINWFNPDKEIAFNFSKGCWNGDLSNTGIEYLDENNNVIFWHSTGVYNTYGLYMTYGKLPNFQGGINPGVVGQHPAAHGILKFDKVGNKVNYVNSQGTHYVNSWELTGIDVNSIKKIRIAYSNVVTKYSGGTCGAQAGLKVLP